MKAIVVTDQAAKRSLTVLGKVTLRHDHGLRSARDIRLSVAADFVGTRMCRTEPGIICLAEVCVSGPEGRRPG